MTAGPDPMPRIRRTPIPALAFEPYDRRAWSREQLSDALGDEALIEEITGASLADPPSGDESSVTLL